MHISKITNNRIPFYVNEMLMKNINNNIRTQSYKEYLKTENKKEKNKRIEVVQKCYDFIFEKK